MRKIFPFLVALLFVFVALAETTHTHKQDCDDSCSTVFLSCGCGVYCDNSDLKHSFVPVEPVALTHFYVETHFVPQTLTDEIFHPPAA